MTNKSVDTTYSRIIGTGSYLPETVLTNEVLSQRVDTNHEWIVERTGIHQRHLAAPQEGTGDLAYFAAQQAIEAANIDPETLDLIILGTTTPDRVYPATACQLQHRIGANGCTAFDVQAVCSGFVYALSVADKFIRCGDARRALVVGADVHSRLLDWEDRASCVLFGDGAGAVVLEADENPGIMSTHLQADGNYESLLYIEGSVADGYDNPAAGPAKVRMEGRDVFKLAVQHLTATARETLAKHDLDCTDLDWLVPHQANRRIIQTVAKKLDLPLEKVVLTLDRQGNTCAASIPLALDAAVRDGRIKRGDLLLLEAFGAGFTWGSALIQY